MTRLEVTPLGAELLDDPGADPSVVHVSLDNIARANRWLGGLAAVRFGMDRLLDGVGPQQVRLLDVGTGLGDVPAMLTRWGTRRGFSIRSIALDRHRAAARLVARRGLPSVVACGGDLPVRSGSVDIVIASQIAHHLDPGSCVTLFRECARVASLGVVVADLRRSRTAAGAFWVAGRVLGFDPVTLADGITSVRRGFSAAELARLLAAAGVRATVHRRPGARLVATWRTG